MLRNIIVGSLAVLLIAAPNAQAPAQQASGEVEFVASQSADQWLTSDLVGRNVKNPSGETVGDVNALLVGSDNEIAAAVLGVGGFLGIGEKRVAIRFDGIERKKDDEGNTNLIANVTKQQLESAPEFKPLSSSGTMEQVKEQASEVGEQVEEAAEAASEKASEMTDGKSDNQQ